MIEENKKEIKDFLQTGSSKKGEELFNRWFEEKRIKVDAELSARDRKSHEEMRNTQDNIKLRIDQMIGFEETSKVKPTSLMVWSSAAAVILFFGLSLFMLFESPVSSKTTVLTASVPKGSIDTIQLLDGSTVIINGGSTLEFPSDFEDRWIRLNGEAFFKVARDESRPFRVLTENLTTEVLGTSFNVKYSRINASVEVYVNSGRVRVSADENNENVLDPGNFSSYSTATGELQYHENAPKNTLAWVTRKIELDQTPITEFANMVSDIYGINVHLNSTSDTFCRLSGTFENASLDEIMESIEFSTGIEYVISEEDLVINNKNACSVNP